MKYQVKVSIITVNYNNCVGLKRTIDSVIKQDYKQHEYIIVDGGSSDGSGDLINEYRQYLSWYCSEKDKGIYNAMNKGIAHANGEYCLFLNSGDILNGATALSRFFSKIDSGQETDLLIARHGFIGNNKKSPMIEVGKITPKFFLSNTFPHQATFIRTELLKSLNGYNEDYKIISDWIFWIEAFIKRHCSASSYNFVLSKMEPVGTSSDILKNQREMLRYLDQNKELFNWNDMFEMSSSYTKLTRVEKTYIGRLIVKIFVSLQRY